MSDIQALGISGSVTDHCGRVILVVRRADGLVDKMTGGAACSIGEFERWVDEGLITKFLSEATVREGDCGLYYGKLFKAALAELGDSSLIEFPGMQVIIRPFGADDEGASMVIGAEEDIQKIFMRGSKAFLTWVEKQSILYLLEEEKGKKAQTLLKIEDILYNAIFCTLYDDEYSEAYRWKYIFHLGLTISRRLDTVRLERFFEFQVKKYGMSLENFLRHVMLLQHCQEIVAKDEKIILQQQDSLDWD